MQAWFSFQLDIAWYVSVLIWYSEKLNVKAMLSPFYSPRFMISCFTQSPKREVMSFNILYANGVSLFITQAAIRKSGLIIEACLKWENYCDGVKNINVRRVRCVLNQPTFYGAQWLSCATKWVILNTLRPRRNGRHFADDNFKRILLNENVRISIEISLKFVPKGPI